MRKVVDGDMVPHLWANQSQSDARNSTSNISFRDTMLFSYSTMIAKLYTIKGVTAALMADRSWSSTTNRHQSWMRRAIRPDQLAFDVLLMEKEHDWHKRNMANYKERIAALSLKSAKARSNKTHLYTEMCALVNQANQYAEFFGLKTRFDADDFDGKKLAEEAKLQTEKDRKQAAIKEKKQQAFYEEMKTKWLAGEDVTIPYRSGNDLLRVRGSRIQTSRGAVVDVTSAMGVLKLMRENTVWQRNGETCPVGDFSLDRIDESFIYIGCHQIARTEIERIAQQLGV